MFPAYSLGGFQVSMLAVALSFEWFFYSIRKALACSKRRSPSQLTANRFYLLRYFSRDK